MRIFYLSTGRADYNMVYPVMCAAQDAGLNYAHRFSAMDLQRYGTPADVAAHVARIVDSECREKEPVAAMVLAGDRYEHAVAAVIAQQYAVPILHLGGGEMGIAIATPDTKYRNAITEMASFHCTFTEAAYNRVVKRTDWKERVFLTGSPALDRCSEIRAKPRPQRDKPLVLVTYHQTPLRPKIMLAELHLIAHACRRLSAQGCEVVVSQPNGDRGRSAVVAALEQFTPVNGFGVQYLEKLYEADLLIGNSSAGRIEASALGTPVLEIGNRQEGRPQPSNIRRYLCGEQVDVKDEWAFSEMATSMVGERFDPFSPWEHPEGKAAAVCVDALKAMLALGEEAVESW